MKEFIALFIVLAVLAALDFAQDAGITFSGWGRGIFAPIQLVDPDEGDAKVYAGVGKNWGPYPRAGFSVKGDAEYVGFRADLFVLEGGLTAGGGVPVGDNAYIWAKPWNFLKVNVGKFKDDTLRGKISDTTFSGGITLGMHAEDDIFTRFSGDGRGAEIALTPPIEGLYIAALVNAGDFLGSDTREAKYVYEKIQVGAGYEIANIGHARAQFVGGSGLLPTLDEDTFEDLAKGVVPTADAPRVEIAFALTAVENLLVDLGAKIWFPATKVLDRVLDNKTGEWIYNEPGDQNATTTPDNGASYTNPIGISVGATYDLDAFKIFGRIDTQIGASYKDDDNGEFKSGFYLNAHLEPSYNLGFATIGADIGFQLNPELTSDDITLDEGGIEFGLGAWIEKDLGNGSIKTGIGVQLPTDAHKNDDFTTKNALVLTIPVILTYWF
jgi:hypothetical protein